MQTTKGICTEIKSNKEQTFNALLNKLEQTHKLQACEYEWLIKNRTSEFAAKACARAVFLRKQIYSNSVFIRGLVEVSNHCKNNCYYCGIRRGNASVKRYRLSQASVLECAKRGYELGFRTFVLQAGEDALLTDSAICEMVHAIKTTHPDCVVTLSLGERSAASYKRFYDAGARRYLLRHEAASEALYSRWHPQEMQLENRIQCLHDLRSVGFCVGAGFMVGAPFQTPKDIACDLVFLQDFKPEMCGIGPFIPHNKTPFANFECGSASLTCFILSLVRIMLPNVLLPATTALNSVANNGAMQGILAGANVVMPNLTPEAQRKNYALYNNKKAFGSESAEGLATLKQQMRRISYEVVVDVGNVADSPKFL